MLQWCHFHKCCLIFCPWHYITSSYILVFAINKHEKKKIIIVKTFKVKDPRKWFYCFWFFNHSLRWFLIVPPKDSFIQLQWLLYWCKQFFLSNLSDQICNCDTFQASHIIKERLRGFLTWKICKEWGSM